MTEVEARLAEVIRVEGARLVATLTRILGDMQLAEDAVQEAAIAALGAWSRTGVPAEPRAWLTVAARRKALDHLRREARRTGKEIEGTRLMELSAPDPPPASVVADDQLRLIFTCCHPALALPVRVALALRTLCGLSTAEVARALLTSEPAMAKRLVRAKHKIATARIPYRVPQAADLPARLTAVCAVIHLVYTAGHAAGPGPDLMRVDLRTEAIRLARLLFALMPDEPSPAALLALLLLTEARQATRVDAAGDPVLLADQDRDLWPAAVIAEGTRLLDASLRRTAGQADALQLQAAIAACHSTAPTFATTDWVEIARLYELLEDVQPGPVVSLNRAVAVAEADGPRAGLALVATIADLDDSHLLHAARGELLARLGRRSEAAAAFARALECSPTVPETRHLRRRLAAMRPEGP